MKEIKSLEKKYLEDFDIFVDSYLTYEQIDQIVRAISKEDNWSIREQMIDMLILYHVTDIKKEDLEKVGHEDLLKSGLIDEVKLNVKNLNRLQDAINYSQSFICALKQFSEKMPELKKYFLNGKKKYGATNKK